MAQRHRKSLLGAVKQIVRQDRLQRTLQDPFALPIRIFEPVRQAKRPLHKSMVQHRYADFQAGGHARAVHLGQNIAHQPGFQVHILSLPNGIIRRRLGHVMGDQIRRTIPLQRSLQVRREELIAKFIPGD